MAERLVTDPRMRRDAGCSFTQLMQSGHQFVVAEIPSCVSSNETPRRVENRNFDVVIDVSRVARDVELKPSCESDGVAFASSKQMPRGRQPPAFFPTPQSLAGIVVRVDRHEDEFGRLAVGTKGFVDAPKFVDRHRATKRARPVKASRHDGRAAPAGECRRYSVFVRETKGTIENGRRFVDSLPAQNVSRGAAG